jgi:hypothetical protein
MLKNTRLAKLRLRSQPEYIVFEDVVRVRVPESSDPKSPYSIPTPELTGQTVSMETMYELFEKHGQSHDQMEWELRRAYDYAEYINRALANEQVPESIRAGLRLDILNLTQFEGQLIKWVIRDILREYKIPFEHTGPDCELPVDEDGEILMPSIKRKDANETLFTDVILVLAKHYKPRTEPESKVQVVPKHEEANPDDTPVQEQLQSAIDKFNSHVGLPQEPNPKASFTSYQMSKCWDLVINQHKPVFGNVRPCGPSDWSYMTSELRDKHLATEPANAWELVSLFRTDGLGLTLTPQLESLSYALKFSNASIVNMLIYGKTNISQEMVPTLLGLIRFAEDSQHSPPAWTQLDNYIIDHTGMYLSDLIKWRDDNLHGLDFAKTETQRLSVARSLIHLMNETDPKVLNMVNYYQIGAWIHVYRQQVEKLGELIQADSANRNQWLDPGRLD